jgi:hypothetical protein
MQHLVKQWTDRAALHTALAVDHGHNMFVGASTLQGNTTVIEVYRLNEQLVETGHWTITPAPEIKIDDFHMIISGADLMFAYVGHKAISDPNRPNPLYFVPDELRGVAIAYPQGVQPVGGEFNVNTEPNPNPNPEPIDYAAIAHAVLDEMKAQMNGELGSQVQQKAKNGAVDAIRRETPDFLKTETAFGQALYNSDGLFRRLKETVWLSFWKVGYETHLLQFLANSLHTDIQIPDPVCAELHLTDCVVHAQ